MKKPETQEKTDKSENVTMTNPENSANQPDTDMVGPGKINKIASKAPTLSSEKDPVKTPLVAAKGDDDVMSQERS